MQNNREIGTKYEKLVGKYLEQKGYDILCYNYHSPLGEIDMVALHGETLVFVEVKYRKSLRTGSPLEAVNAKKQKVISKCARYYMMCKYPYGMACRFDVVGVLGTEQNLEITHIENAFEYSG